MAQEGKCIYTTKVSSHLELGFPQNFLQHLGGKVPPSLLGRMQLIPPHEGVSLIQRAVTTIDSILASLVTTSHRAQHPHVAIVPIRWYWALMAVARNVSGETSIKVLRWIVVKLLEEAIGVEDLNITPLLHARPLLLQSSDTVLHHSIYTMDKVEGSFVPKIAIMDYWVVNCRGGVIAV